MISLSHFLVNTLGLSKIPNHLSTIIYSFTGFTFIHLVFAPWICRRWFPTAYSSKNKAVQNNWAIHIVSQVHTVIIVPLAFYAVWTEDKSFDRAFGWSDCKGFVHAIAVGYFLWDTLDAIVNYVDMGFIVHGIACFLVYGMSYRPFVAYYGTRCLLWETSTFFLNIHWFCDKTGRTGSTLQLINGAFLLSTFFGVRLIYGASVSLQFLFTLFQVWHDIPTFYSIVYGGGNLVLQGLNIFWFTKMIAALRKRFGPRPDETEGLLGHNGAAPTPN